MSSTSRPRSASVSAYRAAHLSKVTDPFTEILIQTVKRFQPEELAIRIRDFDQDVCKQGFLSELKPVLPNPEQARFTSLCHHHKCTKSDF